MARSSSCSRSFFSCSSRYSRSLFFLSSRLKSASTLSYPNHSAGGSLATPRLRTGAGLGDLALLAAEVDSVANGRDEALVAALEGLEALVAGRDLVSATLDESRDLNVRSEPDV
jgi:hypothetical protein